MSTIASKCRTIGELREFLKDVKDDVVIIALDDVVHPTFIIHFVGHPGNALEIDVRIEGEDDE